MIDPLAVMTAAYALFHATHGIADYWVQRDWQAQNKSKRSLLPFAYNHLEGWKWAGWNKAVLSHSVEYALCFLPALWFLSDYTDFNWLLALFSIWLPHAWMDTRRFLNWFVHTTKGWDAPNSFVKRIVSESEIVQWAVRVHVTIEMDQKFHYACLLGSAYLIAYVL